MILHGRVPQGYSPVLFLFVLQPSFSLLFCETPKEQEGTSQLDPTRIKPSCSDPIASVSCYAQNWLGETIIHSRDNCYYFSFAVWELFLIQNRTNTNRIQFSFTPFVHIIFLSGVSFRCYKSCCSNLTKYHNLILLIILYNLIFVRNFVTFRIHFIVIKCEKLNPLKLIYQNLLNSFFYQSLNLI